MSTEEKYLPHLLELRTRLIRCLIAFVIVLCPLLFFSSELYTLIAQPIIQTLPQGSLLIATQVITPFTVPLKLAFFTTLVLCIPYVFYQAWAFVAPGLYPQEKKITLPLLLLSISLFYIGMLFAHFIVLPMAIGFFTHIAPAGVTVMTDMTHYLDFILVLYFSFGLSFQVPIITYLLVRVGITTVADLKKHRPYIIVGTFVVAMLLTPPDVISQILLAFPLLGLFESGLWLSTWLIPDQFVDKSVKNQQLQP